jgi:hypothetical protein
MASIMMYAYGILQYPGRDYSTSPAPVGVETLPAPLTPLNAAVPVFGDTDGVPMNGNTMETG